MYAVEIRDHVMIAHSLSGAVFGPAQQLHGATYVVDVELRRAQLDENGVVVDIGRAAEALRGVLAKLSYRNLDELPEFGGKNTTTEFLARFVCEQMASAFAGLSSIKVTLHESHVAWASYEQELSRRE